MLDIIVSELSMIIWENDYKTENELNKFINEYVEYNYSYLTPNNKWFVIDEAYKIYFNK